MALLAAGGQAGAQSFMPDVAFSGDIPTAEAVLGAPAGERITPPEDVLAYFRALQAAAPDRMVIRSYAESWQGRELIYAIIGSPENIARLDEVADGMQALADPRETTPAEAGALVDSLPGVAWLAYGVHGDEISSSDAAMMTAYHLLAAENDATVDGILENTLVFIDPMQNPDGRARFTNFYYDTLGLAPAGSPIAAERNQPWPGGRYNHYLFDMNRDWFALTQPETRGRVAAFLEWRPLVFVDLHEMSADSTYFFAPEADPYNPDITQGQRDTLNLVGRNNARWFDRFGFSYFTREVYDAFYPGYGAEWPLFQGAIGTTYEQASARGLVARRSDGEDLTYSDGVRHHFTSSIATLETVSDNREKLLQDFYDYRASAVSEGRTGEVRAYIAAPQQDQSTLDKLAGILAAQGIETHRASETFMGCGVEYPEGSYYVPMDQPAGRLARTLLAPDVPIDPAFMEEQERRRAKDLEPEIYDVTAWSLPLMFNLEMESCGTIPAVASEPVEGYFQPRGTVENRDAEYGFLVPWGSTAAARLLAEALKAGMPVASSDAAFTIAGRDYPAGTLVFRNADIPDLSDTMRRLARRTGADAVGIDDSWVAEGPSFGSDRVPSHPAPRIAIAWGDPTRSQSAGNTRFVIERQIGYPVTPVRTEDLSSPYLSQFDVLILPSGGNYMGVLGEGGAAALAEWVREGGVLIAMDGAVRFIANPATGLVSIRRETAYQEEGEGGSDAGDEAFAPGALLESAEDLLAAEKPVDEPPDALPGALLNARTDPDHWLGAGVKETLHVLAGGSDIYTPARRDEGVNVVSFAAPEDLVASGYVWEETRLQLALKPFVVVEPEGRGYVIAFTQDPTVRAYLDGLNVLLANAIFRAPAHARPAR